MSTKATRPDPAHNEMKAGSVVPVIAVHGGAGKSSPEQEAGIRAALAAGYKLLGEGRPALDAACAAVVVLEDDPAFNAGRGAARTADNTVELDAAVMRGEDRAAGAVAAISRLRNPVLVARAVLQWSPHVMLAGHGAEEFAFNQGFTPVGDWHFGLGDTTGVGTVGAVALDASGGLAAATSTGGAAGKAKGRVGDSPLIGSGTYADAHCAISATGDGEAFIRVVFAHTVATNLSSGATLEEACDAALSEVAEIGGSGGCIALTNDGNVSLRFTTRGMPRGWANESGISVVV